MINKNDLRRLKGVDTTLAMIFYEAQRTCPYEIHVGRYGGRRSAETQNMLYRKGKSKKDGYQKLSKHQKGIAVDFVIYNGSNPDWDIEKYTKVAGHIMDVGAFKFNTRLRWGGDWDMDGVRVDRDPDEGFLDGGHIEMI